VRAHAYTGCLRPSATSTKWVGHCKCGYRSPESSTKQGAQLALVAHIQSASGLSQDEWRTASQRELRKVSS
jgi:hypothetical protein